MPAGGSHKQTHNRAPLEQNLTAMLRLKSKGLELRVSLLISELALVVFLLLQFEDFLEWGLGHGRRDVILTVEVLWRRQLVFVRFRNGAPFAPRVDFKYSFNVPPRPTEGHSRRAQGRFRAGHRRKGFQRRFAQSYLAKQGSLQGCASSYGRMVSQCFSVRPCDIHTELIPASQHANQFSPVTKDQYELFYSIRMAPGQQNVLSELPIPSSNVLSVRSNSCAAVVNI